MSLKKKRVNFFINFWHQLNLIMFRKKIKEVEIDEELSNNDSQQEDAFQFNERGNDFFNGLFTDVKQLNKKTNYEKLLKQTEQPTTKTTSLQSKIQNKLRNKTYRSVQKSEEQPQEDVPEEKKQKQEFNKSLFALETEFQQLGLSKGLIKAVNELGYQYPTQIQKQAIPLIISGKDILASSITGSGKTAAFLLPVLQRFAGTKFTNYIKVLIVTPTRELALQCYEMLEKLNKYTKCTSSLIMGAVPIQKQEAELRKHPDIIIATPGRIVDLLKNSYSIDIQNIEMLIFDEADRLLEMGFESEIKEIVKETPKDKQTVLFSATMNSGIVQLSSLALKKPVKIEVDYEASLARGLEQYLVRIRSNQEKDREAVLLSLIMTRFTQRCIIFVKTKKNCHRIAIILGLLNLRVSELHGNLSQHQRIETFEQFKNGNYDFLLATDLASRGLDIENLKTVINLEIPQELSRYIHRVGRTARIGNQGTCLTICLDNEAKEFKKMIRQSEQSLLKIAVSQKDISFWQNKIQKIEKNVQKILKEERFEMSLRRAEMFTEKAENLMEHQDEIKNRPRRKWIENYQQKIQRQKGT